MPSQASLAQLPIGQIGFGAMRITGPGVWGPPRDEAEAIALLRRAIKASLLSTPPTLTAPGSVKL